jgi:hypothetical protein
MIYASQPAGYTTQRHLWGSAGSSPLMPYARDLPRQNIGATNAMTVPASFSGTSTFTAAPTPSAAGGETAAQTAARLAQITAQMQAAGYTNITTVGSGSNAAVRGARAFSGGVTESMISKPGMV